jgi:hypothetical protein
VVNSRRKGKVAENEWAGFCRDRFKLVGARRSQQYRGTADSEDVLTFPGTHCEVKRVQTLNVEKAMQQAEADAEYAVLRFKGHPSTTTGINITHATIRTGDIPYVAHRKNNTSWLVTVRADDLIAFCQRVLASQEQP